VKAPALAFPPQAARHPVFLSKKVLATTSITPGLDRDFADLREFFDSPSIQEATTPPASPVPSSTESVEISDTIPSIPEVGQEPELHKDIDETATVLEARTPPLFSIGSDDDDDTLPAASSFPPPSPRGANLAPSSETASIVGMLVGLQQQVQQQGSLLLARIDTQQVAMNIKLEDIQEHVDVGLRLNKDEMHETLKASNDEMHETLKASNKALQAQIDALKSQPNHHFDAVEFKKTLVA
jgi:hypothetical protein